MTSKRYLSFILLFVVLTVASVAGINYYLNLFGLFGSEPSLRIWVDEKTSKYLLSFRYVPENFEGIIIGPSVSANMQTKAIHGFKIYNLSMNGGNISEIKYAADNVINNRNIKYLIVCLYPYLTKNSGIKGRQISEKEYWGSLYSVIPFRMAAAALVYKIKPGLDRFHSSEWGFDDANMFKKNIVFKNLIEHKLKVHPKNIVVDPVALSELGEVITSARSRGIRIMAYYFPVYYQFLDVYKESGSWVEYQGRMSGLFQDGDYVWDMNEGAFDYLTHNTKTYIDGHLSDWGAREVVKVIEKKLKLVSANREKQ